ncbi:hypothetical protein C8Q73DRAFT_787366 [Cubamyces lactineus]|nr:hypothetical protein C8Q73DRAFT_787366 [Cubamyces lactineus]
MTATPVVIVDDADPAIYYGTPDLWNHTKYAADVHDATYSAGYTNATAKLSFNGTSVEVYVAVIQPQTQKRIDVPEATFTVDGAPSEPVSAGLTSNSLDPEYNFLLFASYNMTAGPHTLEILVNYADEEDGWPFMLDYIQYVPLDDTMAASSSSTASSSSSPSPTVAQASLAEKHRGSPLGPVIGGLIGGLVFTALLAFTVYIWLRRRRRRILAVPHCALTASGPSRHMSEPKAFPVIPPRPLAIAPVPPLRPAAPPIAVSAFLATPLSPTSGAASPVVESPTSPVTERSALKPGSQRQLGSAAARLLRSARRASVRVYHSDSGLRFGPPTARERGEGGPALEDARSDDAYSEIPPQYTEH